MEYTYDSTKLTNDNINESNPYVAANGDISWEAEPSENNHNIWYYGADNEESRAIASETSNETNHYISYEGETTSVVYEREMGEDNKNIYYWNSEGTNTPIAETPNYEGNPEVYGNYVAYEYASNPENKDIYLYNASNDQTIHVAEAEYSEYNPHLFGDYLVYEAESSPDNTDLYSYNVTNGETTEIATSGKWEGNAQLWDNGDVVYEYKAGENNSDIRYYDSTSGETKNLAHSNYNETHGDIAGNYVTWQAWDGNDWEVYRYDAAKDETNRLTNNDLNDYAPEVSAEGHVTYQHQSGENNSDVYLYTDTGTLRLGMSNHNEINPDIYGNEVTWQAWDGHDYEVYSAQISLEM